MGLVMSLALQQIASSLKASQQGSHSLEEGQIDAFLASLAQIDNYSLSTQLLFAILAYMGHFEVGCQAGDGASLQ